MHFICLKTLEFKYSRADHSCCSYILISLVSFWILKHTAQRFSVKMVILTSYFTSIFSVVTFCFYYTSSFSGSFGKPQDCDLSPYRDWDSVSPWNSFSICHCGGRQTQPSPQPLMSPIRRRNSSQARYLLYTFHVESPITPKWFQRRV